MKFCKICGNPLASNKLKYCCGDCRQEGEKMSKRDGDKVARWRKHVKESEKRLDEKIKRATANGMTYGEYVGIKYLEKIRSEQNGKTN